MRRLGLVLIVAGLAAVMVTLIVGETGAEQTWLTGAFYAGAAACGIGVILIVARRFAARLQRRT